MPLFNAPLDWRGNTASAEGRRGAIGTITGAGGGTPWSPVGKFDAEWDFRDITKLFQDTGRTTPVTTIGQSVAGVTDKQGSYHLSNAVPPSYTTVEGRGSIAFNGTTQYAQCDAIATLLSGDDKPFTIAWVELDDDGGPGSNQNRWFASSSSSASPRLGMLGIGDGTEQFTKRDDANAVTNVSTLVGTEGALEYWVLRFNGTTVDIWLNGTKVIDGSACDRGVQTLNTFLLGAQKLGAGAIGGFWNGKYSWMAIKQAAFSDFDVAGLNTWLQTNFPVYKPTGALDFFVVTGQSNAEGRGDKTQSPIVPFGDGWYFNGASFYPLNDPVGGASDGSMWPAFAIQWKALTGRTAVFLSKAVGGTSVSATRDEWRSGGAHNLAAIAAMNSAITRFATAGIAITGRYYVWSEGETYSDFIKLTTRTQSDYETDLTAAFNALIAGTPTLDRIFQWQTGYTSSNSADITAGDLIHASQDTVDVAIAKVTMVSRLAKDFVPIQLHWTQSQYNQNGTTGATNAVASL